MKSNNPSKRPIRKQTKGKFYFSKIVFKTKENTDLNNYFFNLTDFSRFCPCNLASLQQPLFCEDILGHMA
jgi:hypothetical protein